MSKDSGPDLVVAKSEPSEEENFASRNPAGARATVQLFKGSWESPAEKERFLQQARALAEVEHPNLVRSLGSGCLPDGRPYVVSEPLDGEDLQSHLAAHGPLTAEEVVLLVNPLCGALEQLRNRGLTIGSLHPNQIFLSGGLAAFSPKLAGAGLTDFPVRPAGSQDLRLDVCALGSLMYEAYTGVALPPGQEPFAGATGPSAADWLRAVIRRCMNPQPTERFATPLEVARALEGYLPNTYLPAPAGAEPVKPPGGEGVREKEGDVLGNYQLVRLLGEGAMGRVFLGRHIKLGRPVALKILRVEHAHNGALIQRFFQEAKAVNQINHENIIEIFDFVEEKGTEGTGRVYCVMEMLEGRSLTEVLKSGPLSIARAVAMTQQVCRALAAAHQVGVIHRDIKPDNLVLCERTGNHDFVKVLDFGIAKLVSPLPDFPMSSTAEGTIVGTPTYMSPEQASGVETDGRTDLYAVGTVLYEMLCGHPPFQGPTFGQLVAQVITFPPPALPALTPSGERIPQELKEVVMRCLAKAPVDRFGGMVELEQALEPFHFEEPVRSQHSRRRMLQRWGAAAVLMLGIFLLLARSTSSSGLLPGRSDPRPRALRPLADLRPPPARGQPPVTLVTLRVDSRPSGARVVRADTGALLGLTPLVQQLPKDSPELRLRVEAPGHEPAEKRVALSEDVSWDVQLLTPPLVRHRPPKRPARPHRDAMTDPFAL